MEEGGLHFSFSFLFAQDSSFGNYFAYLKHSIALFFLLLSILFTIFFALVHTLLMIDLWFNLLNHNFSNTRTDSNHHVAVRLNVELSDPPSGSGSLGFEYCLEAVVCAAFNANWIVRGEGCGYCWVGRLLDVFVVEFTN